jgi:hypothetical protein
MLCGLQTCYINNNNKDKGKHANEEFNVQL